MDRTKPHVQVFLLFPEPEPQQFYLKNHIGYQTEEYLVKFISKINSGKSLIAIENYLGFYDAENIKQFIQHYNVLEDYYLNNPSSVLRSQLKGWHNWRDERFSIEDFECTLLGKTIADETFTEVVVRSESDSIFKYVVVSHNALNIPTNTIHHVELFDNSFPVECVELKNLPLWFSGNRMPQRNYHHNPKHGENGAGEWSGASKLLCSRVHAAELLIKALGSPDIDELYLLDDEQNKYIIFRYEGDNPLNQYHAYHLENNAEVPKTVQVLNRKLRELTQDEQ